MRLEERARAKINLALHVRRKRADGYHEIETVFAFCEAGDVVGVAPPPPAPLRGVASPIEGEEHRAFPPLDGEGDSAIAERGGVKLEIDGPFAAGLSATDNLVRRAADVLRAAAGIDAPVHLTLTKTLPVASGIGGGSADAAAALRLLDRVWALDWPLERLAEIGAALGADVPACVWSRTMRGAGVGEALTPVDLGLTGKAVLLVNPGVAVPTVAVFAAWDGIDRGPLPDDPLNGRNDLEAPARALAPVIGEVLEALAATRPTLARMSGSGATCFALYADTQACASAASAISARRPGWWVMPTRLV